MTTNVSQHVMTRDSSTGSLGRKSVTITVPVTRGINLMGLYVTHHVMHLVTNIL